MNKPFLIGIAGGSGAGKSWLANKIREDVGVLVTSISQDDFYIGADARFCAPNYDHPNAIDWEMFNRKIAGLRIGEKIDIPNYSFVHRRCTGFRTVTCETLVVVDGTMLFWHERTRENFQLRVFVEASKSERCTRRINRDIRERGRKKLEILKQLNLQVLPMHEIYVEPTRRHADLVIKSNDAGKVFQFLVTRFRTDAIEIPDANAGT